MPLPSFRVEAWIGNPSEEIAFEGEHETVHGRQAAREQIRRYWEQGYWVEVYHEGEPELIAGPIDPDAAFPSYTV